MTALHSWAVEIDSAKEIQRHLRERVVRRPIAAAERIDTVAGADISYSRGSDQLYAAVVVLDFETLEPVERGCATMEVPFPYVPGLLSFREGPPLLRAFATLDQRPDLLVCDGHGYAHPRRFGLACHIGLWLEIPTVGVAKNVLVGQPEEPDTEKGSAAPLVAYPDSDSTRAHSETIGAVLRTRTEVNPVYVSVGHRATLETAVERILSVSPTYKIPEPIRQAHAVVNELRQANESGSC